MPAVESAIVVLDVGGTTLSAATIVGDDLVGEPARDSSHESASADVIVDHFAGALDRARAARPVDAYVVALPAPFDYERGVSHMEHKFVDLAGVDLRARLTDRGFDDVLFVNDAEAAAVGCWIGLGRPAEPVATITLGTGVGSGLVVAGEFVGHNEIWCQSYAGGIVEAHVSSRALSGRYAQRTGQALPVASIAVLADAGERAARREFAEFGSHLGVAIADYFKDAEPAFVVVAGGVTGAWLHIGPAADAAYRAAGGTALLRLSSVAEPALVGGAELGRRHRRSRGRPSK